MKEKLNLMWRSESSTFIIGELIYSDERYYYKYNPEEVKKASEEGFQLLEGFPRVNSKYFSEEPFKLFTSWTNHGKTDETEFEDFRGLNHERFSFETVIEDLPEEEKTN